MITGMFQAGRAAAVLSAILVLSGLSACSTATPILLQTGSSPSLQGRANVSAGYTGELTTDNKSCRGSFTGQPGHPVVALEISCGDGRRGLGTATIQDGVFVSGQVRLNDGSAMTVRQYAPTFP